MAVVTVLGTGVYIGAEVQFAFPRRMVSGSSGTAHLRFGVYSMPIDTPTTPRELRVLYGTDWGIPQDARPLLISDHDYKWIDDDDIVSFGDGGPFRIVEFIRPRPGSTKPTKRKWWRR